MSVVFSSDELKRFIARGRRRWLWGQLLRRATYGMLGMSLGLIGAGLLAARAPLDSDLIGGLRVGTALAVFLLAYAVVIRPLRRRPDDVAVAQFIEERRPEFEDRLVTAVEILARPEASRFSPTLVQRLMSDALARCATLSAEDVLPSRLLRRRAAGAILPALFLALVVVGDLGSVRVGLQRLYAPWTLTAPPTFGFRVHPGDVRIPRGLDLLVTATPWGFETESAGVLKRSSIVWDAPRLLLRAEGETTWHEHPMERQPDGRSFRFVVANLQRSIEYLVVSGSVRSPTFRAEVVEWPRVSRLEILYVYPAYTGWASRRVEDGGDIVAVKGTTVTVTAHLTGRVHGARVVFDTGSSVPMAPAGEMRFAARFPLTKDARYHIAVQPLVGESYAASREYQITVLEDAPPTLVLEKPGRDLSVTALEEVFIQARVEDDYGVARVDLVYTINGGPERVQTLYRAQGHGAQAAPVRTITGTHTFFLEEWGLQPGDVISYYVRARDINTATGPGEAMSDIYFLEVRPFDRRFRQAQQAPRGAGAEESASAFAQRQKEIIAATWRVVRERARASQQTFRDDMNALQVAQARLRDDVQNVMDRIRRRVGDALPEMPEFQMLSDALLAAIREMGRALEELRAHRPEGALPFEQRAYQHLRRADSVFREIQVALADRADGGGSARAQDLADLFELELDRTKNQYETVQRDRARARDRQMSEVERRIRELAERQQRLVEESMRRSGEGSAEERLIAEMQEVARRLERLTRERPSAQLEAVRQQIERALREMQQARAAATSGEATAHRMRAADSLRAAERQLAQARRAHLGEEVARLRDRARQAHQQQQQLARELERLRQDASGGSSERLDSLRARRSALAEEVNLLGRDLEEAARRARQEDPDVAPRLQGAADVMRRNRVPEQIAQGNRLLENRALEDALRQERALGRVLEDVVRRLEDAARRASARGPNDPMQEALERARRLAEDLESLRDRASERASEVARSSSARSSGDRRSPETPQASSRRTPEGGRADEARTNPLGSRGRDLSADASAFGRAFPRAGRAEDRGASPPIHGSAEDSVRQMRRELHERVREAEELRRHLMPWRDLSDEVARIIAALRRMDEDRLFDDPEEIARLKVQVLDPLRRVERELSCRLQESAGAYRARMREETAVPPEYRRLVEEYYRRLARRPNP